MSDTNKNIDTAKLSTAIRGGDKEAFRRYYEKTLLYLVAKIQKMTGDRDEAWDIAQDTFVKLWEGRERIDPDKSPDGFVVAMATNAAHDAARKRLVAARYRDEQAFSETDEEPAADARIIRRETERNIDAIIAAMPPQRRKVYLLSREEGLTYNEIAERLNISSATVNRHISMALKELRDSLAGLRHKLRENTAAKESVMLRIVKLISFADANAARVRTIEIAPQTRGLWRGPCLNAARITVAIPAFTARITARAPATC